MADRWTEIDIDWFDPDAVDASAAAFVARVEPLLAPATGSRGVVLNVGWLSDVVLLWSGDLAQPLPLLSRRYERWASRTYGDLAVLVDALRQRLAEAGLPDARVGIFTVGWGEFVQPEATAEIYDLRSEWKRRQPDLYAHRVTAVPGNDLDPRVPLRADASTYAARPSGIVAGEVFGDFFAEQWGHLSSRVGLDVFHFRDGWLGPLVYRRVGPWGTSGAPDAAERSSWTVALRELLLATKRAAPDAMVLLYSSAMGPTVEWTVGGIDLQDVLGVDAVDAFVDQTWGGAWQDWWASPALGWTFQLTNTAAHAAVVRRASRERDAPCRHYRLVETWDGWESWDTLHRTPEKLRWGMWATAHAGALTPEGPRGTDGAYISWMNNPVRQLLSLDDVRFVAEHLALTEASADALEEVHGVVLVHDREGIQHALDCTAGENHSGWGEETLAMTAKWGCPALAAVHADDLPALGGAAPDLRLDALHWPLPGPAAVVTPATGAAPGRTGAPVVVQGRSDLLPPAVRSAAGIGAGERAAAGFVRTAQTRGTPGGYDAEYLPARRSVAASGARVVRSTLDGEPLVTERGAVTFWTTPDWSDPSGAGIDHEQLGSLTPFVHMAQHLSDLLRQQGALHLGPLQEHESVVVSSWTSASCLHVLLGNLETGWAGDSRWARHVELHVPRRHLHGGTELVGEDGEALTAASSDEVFARFELEVPPEGMLLLSGPSR